MQTFLFPCDCPNQPVSFVPEIYYCARKEASRHVSVALTFAIDGEKRENYFESINTGMLAIIRNRAGNLVLLKKLKVPQPIRFLYPNAYSDIIN